jgi:hypothetical protein
LAVDKFDRSAPYHGVFFSFDVGTQYLDRTRNISKEFSIGAAFAVIWVAKLLRKRKGSIWRLVLCISLPLLFGSAYAGFNFEKESVYPARARDMVKSFQRHSREVLAIKRSSLQHEKF